MFATASLRRSRKKEEPRPPRPRQEETGPEIGGDSTFGVRSLNGSVNWSPGGPTTPSSPPSSTLALTESEAAGADSSASTSVSGVTLRDTTLDGSSGSPTLTRTTDGSSGDDMRDTDPLGRRGSNDGIGSSASAGSGADAGVETMEPTPTPQCVPLVPIPDSYSPDSADFASPSPSSPNDPVQTALNDTTHPSGAGTTAPIPVTRGSVNGRIAHIGSGILWGPSSPDETLHPLSFSSTTSTSTATAVATGAGTVTTSAGGIGVAGESQGQGQGLASLVQPLARPLMSHGVPLSAQHRDRDLWGDPLPSSSAQTHNPYPRGYGYRDEDGDEEEIDQYEGEGYIPRSLSNLDGLRDPTSTPFGLDPDSEPPSSPASFTSVPSYVASLSSVSRTSSPVSGISGISGLSNMSGLSATNSPQISSSRGAGSTSARSTDHSPSAGQYGRRDRDRSRDQDQPRSMYDSSLYTLGLMDATGSGSGSGSRPKVGPERGERQMGSASAWIDEELVLPTLSLPSSSLHLSLPKWSSAVTPSTSTDNTSIVSTGGGAGTSVSMTRVVLLGDRAYARGIIHSLGERCDLVQLDEALGGGVGVKRDGRPVLSLTVSEEGQQIRRGIASSYCILSRLLNPNPPRGSEAEIRRICTEHARRAPDWVHLVLDLNEVPVQDQLAGIVPVRLISQATTDVTRHGALSPSISAMDDPTPMPGNHPASSYFASASATGASGTEQVDALPSAVGTILELLVDLRTIESRSIETFLSYRSSNPTSSPAPHLEPTSSLEASVTSAQSTHAHSISSQSQFEGQAPMPTVARASGGGEWEAGLSRRIAAHLQRREKEKERSVRGQRRTRGRDKGKSERDQPGGGTRRKREGTPLFPRSVSGGVGPSRDLGNGHGVIGFVSWRKLSQLWTNLLGSGSSPWSVVVGRIGLPRHHVPGGGGRGGGKSDRGDTKDSCDQDHADDDRGRATDREGQRGEDPLGHGHGREREGKWKWRWKLITASASVVAVLVLGVGIRYKLNGGSYGGVGVCGTGGGIGSGSGTEPFINISASIKW